MTEVNIMKVDKHYKELVQAAHAYITPKAAKADNPNYRRSHFWKSFLFRHALAD